MSLYKVQDSFGVMAICTEPYKLNQMDIYES